MGRKMIYTYIPKICVYTVISLVHTYTSIGYAQRAKPFETINKNMYFYQFILMNSGNNNFNDFFSKEPNWELFPNLKSKISISYIDTLKDLTFQDSSYRLIHIHQNRYTVDIDSSRYLDYNWSHNFINFHNLVAISKTSNKVLFISGHFFPSRIGHFFPINNASEDTLLKKFLGLKLFKYRAIRIDIINRRKKFFEAEIFYRRPILGNPLHYDSFIVRIFYLDLDKIIPINKKMAFDMQLALYLISGANR